MVLNWGGEGQCYFTHSTSPSLCYHLQGRQDSDRQSPALRWWSVCGVKSGTPKSSAQEGLLGFPLQLRKEECQGPPRGSRQ